MRELVDVLAVRRRLGPGDWLPPESFLRDSWLIRHRHEPQRIIISVFPYEGRDGVTREWVHASMSRRGQIPGYADLKLMHAAVFGDGWAYQVFAPPAEHVNDNEYCLHLWGRLDGIPELPNFALAGSI